MIEPKLLLIDASGPQITLGLSIGLELIQSEQFISKHHVQELPGRLRAFVTTWDILVVNIGPGSFTGIRVSLAVAKALAYTYNRRMVGVDAFDVLAHCPKVRNLPTIDVVFSGQLQTVNVVQFQKTQHDSKRGEIRTYPTDSITSGRNLSNHVVSTSSKICSLVGSRSILAFPTDCLIGLQHAAMDRISRELYDDPFRLEPYYVRPSSAEEKWFARQTKAT